ncbi:MAG: pyridoxal phosphate-dependent aminotransferase [Chloroflexi bacterium]|nr:MAG: pyridoxal phosphate-dependent aminotransferase [Chloroflexota bacterium]MBL1196372.1 pyridoxal phosphate-dependent aminotransferase [Chloroflexota bacterium]NOH13667.1 pyridoxal phosphate-dependent aminotransferase [Chloroflexota bacterium]
MQYDFDKEIDRQGTDSVKWDYYIDEGQQFGIVPTNKFSGPGRGLPMWVADMDFQAPQPVLDALAERARHGIFGYTVRSESYLKAVVTWMKTRKDWEIEAEWIAPSPGVVPGLNLLVQTFVQPGEKVIIQPPVYHPFYYAVENNQAELVLNPLRLDEGRYTMDFDDLATKASDPEVKMAILCHPHNPVGRVWTPEELTRFGEICLENEVLVVSDEIHGDLLYSGVEFTPFAALSEEFAQNSITGTGGSKTFNLAGLHTSNMIIPNQDLRERFEKTLLSNGLMGSNTFGLLALEMAYREGEEWLAQVLVYVEDNLRAMRNYFREHIPDIKVVEPEGTYLVWLDCRGLGLDKGGLTKLLEDKAGVYLDGGHMFGPEGEGFMRMNIACPRPILMEALERVQRAIKD